MRLTQPDIDAPNIVWAKWWASRGWNVFPCWWPVDGDTCGCGKTHSNGDSGKHPIYAGTFKIATTDADQINAWWTEYPLANIGATPPAGQVVVDIDGPTDVEFPETWTHSTGKGKHLVYVNNLEFPLEQTNPQNAYWPNVDTRVSGKGYIILPPSKHRSGTRYAIVDTHDIIEFPTSMAQSVVKKTTASKSKPVGDSEIIKLLTMDRDSPQLGDDAMAKVGGYLARYMPDKDHWFATLSAINAGLEVPLDTTAMNKKRGIWDKHQESIKEAIERAESDEARGWLYEMGDVGYSTGIDVKGTIEYVPFNDFRVECRGIVRAADSTVFIVDFKRGDEYIRQGEKLSASTLANTARLREWLANRGMLLHANQRDTRPHYGMRLMSMLMSQKPRELKSRDHYGWCDETKAFLIDKGEVTAEGLRPFTDVYPADVLAEMSPVNFIFESDIQVAREHLKRVLGLQPDTESAKIGAWAMMMLLRGQWKGLLPGLSVNAFAGTGKTTYFQLLSKLLGSTAQGDTDTYAVARNQLAGNSNGYLWLDDSDVNSGMQELLRQAVTEQRVRKMGKNTASGDWGTSSFQLRGSVILTGESSSIGRQKAVRDRFIPIEFVVNETEDAEKLKNESIENGSGALLMAVLKEAHRLSELEALREGVTSRDKQGQTTLRIGARILDAVLETGTKYTTLVDAWYEGDAIASNLGNASENVLHVWPRIWRSIGEPRIPGFGDMAHPLFYNEDEKCFYISAIRCDMTWKESIGKRERDLTTQAAMKAELKACGADTDTAVKTRVGPSGTPGKAVKYRKLPERYSAMMLAAVEHIDDDELED